MLLKIENTPIKSFHDVSTYFDTVPHDKPVTLLIGLTEQRAMNEQTGMPFMYFDQLVAILQHLQQIKHEHNNKFLNGQTVPKPSSTVNRLLATCNNLSQTAANVLQPILPKSKIRSKKLTRHKLQNSKSWNLWLQSEWKQLDQYESQDTFGLPCPLPPNANCLNLLWVYNVKDDGTLKVCCVCNGQPQVIKTLSYLDTHTPKHWTRLVQRSSGLQQY